MAELPTRTLRNYLASLPNGTGAGVVDQSLVIRTDLATMAQAVPTGGTTGQVLTKISNVDLNIGWTTAGVGDMLKSVYDPTNVNADAFARANQTGTQSYTTITGLGSAALNNTADFATAAQGALADTAVQPAAVQTLTNKRITRRITTIATTATLTPNADTQDATAVTAQATGLTIASPTGTPTDAQQLVIRIRDNGTTRALTWNAAYVPFVAGQLPATTTINKTHYLVFWWNSATAVWELVGGNPVPGLWGA